MKDGIREEKRIISMMSGTSADSIDVGFCLVRPDLTCELIEGINVDYSKEIRQKIFNLFTPQASIKDVCQMNFVLGECFANAAGELIKKYGKPDFIANHGQTIYHYPFEEKLDGKSLKSTLQIGESSVIAQKTNCLTISNFREADIAQGGNGAPLVCFADEVWFKHAQKTFAIQNIGGISNVTVVSPNCETFGFDTGVGNIMLDYCSKKYFNQNYDKNGEQASRGTISQSWLNCLLEDEYYFVEPPKTTGREYFSNFYIENTLKIAPENPNDILATLSALVAKSISLAYERFIYPKTSINEVVIGGGGAYNLYLLKLLRQYLPKHVVLKTHEDFNISNNFKEVMAFALLAYCTYYNIENNLPACTGADKKVVLGKFTNCSRDIVQ